MKKNMGSNDKLIRLGIAIIVIILYYKQVLTGTVGLVSLVVAFILTLTSLIGFCPLYRLLGINTCKTEEK
jgi:hypothetical protein